MNTSNRWARQFAVVLLLGALGAAEASANAIPRSDVRLTERDVAESTDEAVKVHEALAGMWSGVFEQLGRRFVTPRLYAYRGTVRTACGVMSSGNAAYCGGTNAIYFDEVFVARQRKLAGARLGTDGDMAGIGVIAHEVGHAVALQLGLNSRVTYDNEAIADCFTGVFARQAERDGLLEEGDLDEAILGMAAAGDPEVELTGDRRIDARRLARARMMGHGTSEQRVANFQTGYRRGVRGCIG